jgi:ribosomal protein L11 methyltransferase
MKWYEIIVNTTSEGTELVADAFFSIGLTGGVKIIDKNDILDVIKNNKTWDYIDEKLLNASEIVKVSGFVSYEELSNKTSELIDILDSYKVNYGEITQLEIDDDDWYNNWKRYYSPIIADKFVIVPKWINYENTENKTVIYMDPGMAFGTGEHESTKICLNLMSGLDFHEKNVIDIGTGSGILGIGAILSGAKSCYMCDVDSIAVKAAKENSILNKVEDKASIELADLLTKADMQCEIILANLTANILIRLANDLPRYIKKGGYLVCSGIIRDRKNEVMDKYENLGFTIIDKITMGEWVGIKFRYN